MKAEELKQLFEATISVKLWWVGSFKKNEAHHIVNRYKRAEKHKLKPLEAHEIVGVLYRLSKIEVKATE